MHELARLSRGVVVLMISSASTVLADEVPKITLAQALSTALAHNPAIALAKVEISARGAGVAAARAPFDTALQADLDVELARRPTPERADGQVHDRLIGGQIGYAHRFDFGTQVGLTLSHRYSDSAGAFSVLAPQFNTELRATASQPILRGFGSNVSLALIGAAQTQEEAAKLDAQRIAHEVLANVAISYWFVAQAEEEVVIRRRVLERAQRVQELTSELIKRGSLPLAADVQARSTVALRRARMHAVERIRDEAQYSLVGAILDKAPGRVTAADPLPVPSAAPAELTAGAAERVDVRAATLRARALEQEVAVFEDRARPVLDLTLFAGLSGLGGMSNPLGCSLSAEPGAAGCLPDGDFVGYGKSWSTLLGGGYYSAGLGATLVLPIIDEGAVGQAQQARVAVDRAKLAADALRRQAEVDIAALRGLVLSDRRAFETAEQARTVTLELIGIEEQRYKVGSATTFDVLRVQDDLAEAESLASTARAAVLVSDVRYQLAAGRVLEHLKVATE